MMYSRCILVFLLSIGVCTCPWVRLDGPGNRGPPKSITITNGDEKTSLSISPASHNYKNEGMAPVPNSPFQNNDFLDKNGPMDKSQSSPAKTCCGDESAEILPPQTGQREISPDETQLTTTFTSEIECCGYDITDKEIEKSLNDIHNLTNEREILDEIDSLLNSVSNSMQTMVDGLTLAVLIPEWDKKTDTDIVWQFKEPTGADEIDITLPRGIVTLMNSQDIYFKLAILKHNGRQSFKTTSKNGKSIEHGPFIIVQTTSEKEISDGTTALEFKIYKKQLEYPKAKWNCMFWNEQTHLWENRGVKTINNDEYITCTSNHLSAFSVVIDPYSRKDGYDNDSTLLTVFSVIGSLLTIPCATITIIMYSSKRVRRKKISSKILINCCISLILLHCAYMLFTLFPRNLPCWFLNFLVHFGVSSTLLWTAADGINMWRKLFVDIFDKRKTIFYRWSKIISWGFPLLTSLIGILVTIYEGDTCYIYFEYQIFYYFLPCTLMITCNIIFFSVMFSNVVCKNKIKSLSDRKRKYIMSLVQVFGMLWCFSYPLLLLNIRSIRVLGHVIFTFFVSTQGIVIFLVRCVNEREIRGELLEYAVYRKMFHRVLKINDNQHSSCRNCRGDVTGIFALSSSTGSGKCFVYSSDDRKL